MKKKLRMKIEEMMMNKQKPLLQAGGSPAWTKKSCKRPHPGRVTKTEIISYIPVVYVTEEALDDMHILIDEAEGEIAWLGAVEKLGNDWLINKIYLVEQTVGAAHADLDNAAYAKLISDILQGPGGVEEANKIAFWGHSHATMAVFTSGTDLETIHECAGNGGEVFISGIFNKDGDALFTIALPHIGVTYKDVDWKIYNPVNPDNELKRKAWQEKIKACCKDKSWHYTAPGQGSLSYIPEAKTYRMCDVYFHGFDGMGQEIWHLYAPKEKVTVQPRIQPPSNAIFEFVEERGTNGKYYLDWRRPTATELAEMQPKTTKWYTHKDGIQRTYPESEQVGSIDSRDKALTYDPDFKAGMHNDHSWE